MVFFFQAEDGIRDLVRSRGLGDVYKRQPSERRRAHELQRRPFDLPVQMAEPRQWVLKSRDNDPLCNPCPQRPQPGRPLFGSFHISETDAQQEDGFQAEKGALSFSNILGAGPSDRLLIAVKNGDQQACFKAIAEYADMNTQDEFGNTALMIGCVFGYTEIVERLLAAGADHARFNLWGFTALHMAAHHGHGDCVTALLKGEASSEVRNSDGQLPADLCHDHSGVAKAFESV
eukprot:TRINITY_DN14298_c0_g1_i3.p1 TRINITY_DN14298_c0_g1~~TRINITY_DN14298_c0_g1_i3.p1  ORF type:complete len:232 (-),score=57.02 TRINITY_DN14298_c0_g1_i3:289-984(-)